MVGTVRSNRKGVLSCAWGLAKKQSSSFLAMNSWRQGLLTYRDKSKPVGMFGNVKEMVCHQGDYVRRVVRRANQPIEAVEVIRPKIIARYNEYGNLFEF